MKLNIPQLVHAKLAKREKHQTVTKEVPIFIFLLNFRYPLCKPSDLMPTLSTLRISKKIQWIFWEKSCLLWSKRVKLDPCFSQYLNVWFPIKEHLSQLHTFWCIYSLRSNIFYTWRACYEQNFSTSHVLKDVLLWICLIVWLSFPFRSI